MRRTDDGDVETVGRMPPIAKGGGGDMAIPPEPQKAPKGARRPKTSTAAALQIVQAAALGPMPGAPPSQERGRK